MTTIAASVPVLRWAAHRARLRDDDLAARFNKWHLWLSGEAQPTLKQLEDFAHKAEEWVRMSTLKSRRWNLPLPR